MSNSRVNAFIEQGSSPAARKGMRSTPRRTQPPRVVKSAAAAPTEPEAVETQDTRHGGPPAGAGLDDLLARAAEQFTKEEAKASKSGRDLHDELEGWCERLATFGEDRLVLGQREPTEDDLFDQWAWTFRDFHGWLTRAGLKERFDRLRARDGVATANVLAWVRASAEAGRLGELARCLQCAASHPGLLSTLRRALRRLPDSLFGGRKKLVGDALPTSVAMPVPLGPQGSPPTVPPSGNLRLPGSGCLLPDGLVDPFRLRVRGVTYGPFRGREWRLLACLWGEGTEPRRKPVPDCDVLVSVYGDDHVKNLPALHSVKNRLSARFLKDRCPLEIHEGEFFYLELTPAA